MKIINPATEEIITELREDGQEELNAKVALLRSGLNFWQKRSLDERIHNIREFSKLLGKYEDGLALTLTREMGKPLQQSRNELKGARTRIKWLTEHASHYLADETMTLEDGVEEKIAYEPLGVIGNISAWNYPYLVGVNVFVPALVAGNAVLYKPSEYATLTGLEIARLFKEAGVPENVFQVVVGGGATGELMTDLNLDALFFTGSYATGQKLYTKLAARMIPCHCELGGKDPLYVTDDISNVASVAAATADGAFYNNGQSCCAVERIYVHENVYDEYVSAFVKEVANYRSGSPEESGVYIGPLARQAQLGVVQSQVDEALAKGAKLAAGGKAGAGPGYYYEPTVLLNVDHSMRLMREESFGPVIGIMKVRNDSEAIRLMQDSEYGLTASVYSKNRERAEAVLRVIDSGTGYWNCCDRVSAPLPWSGRKHSGIGVTLSHAGLRAMTKVKAYHLVRGT